VAFWDFGGDGGRSALWLAAGREDGAVDVWRTSE
jgi:hypothetical protein